MIAVDSVIDKLNDVDVLALTIYGEGRGEPVEGQIAIGSVVRNRVKVGDYSNYKMACLSPNQFSCWNKDDINYPILLDLADKIISNKIGIAEVPSYHQARFIASGIVDGFLKSNVGNAMNYITNALYASQSRPSWISKMAIVREIGNHIFLRK